MLALVCVATQWTLHRAAHYGYDRDLLPAYDAYAYVALAEHPRVFTVTPWAYRALTPWIVSLCAGRRGRAASTWCRVAGLLLAAVLLFAFLRQLGHGAAGSLLAMVAFLFASATGEIVAVPVPGRSRDARARASVPALPGARRGRRARSRWSRCWAAFAKELQALIVPRRLLRARSDADGFARAPCARPSPWVAATLAAMLVLRTWVTLPAGRP